MPPCWPAPTVSVSGAFTVIAAPLARASVPAPASPAIAPVLTTTLPIVNAPAWLNCREATWPASVAMPFAPVFPSVQLPPPSSTREAADTAPLPASVTVPADVICRMPDVANGVSMVKLPAPIS